MTYDYTLSMQVLAESSLVPRLAPPRFSMLHIEKRAWGQDYAST